MYKFALLGCGRISKNHIEALAKLKEEKKQNSLPVVILFKKKPIQ